MKLTRLGEWTETPVKESAILLLAAAQPVGDRQREDIEQQLLVLLIGGHELLGLVPDACRHFVEVRGQQAQFVVVTHRYGNV